MDSLLANYGSSEDEEESPRENKKTLPQSSTAQTLKSSIFSSLPQQKQELSRASAADEDAHGATRKPAKPSSYSLFTSLPPPKSDSQRAPSNQNPKRVILFKPPILQKPPDSDDEEEEEKHKKRRRDSESAAQTSMAKSFLDFLPAPKQSSVLGAAPLGSGLGRRSMIQNETLASVVEDHPTEDPTTNNIDDSQPQQSEYFESGYVDYGSYAANQPETNDYSNFVDYGNQAEANGYSNYADYGVQNGYNDGQSNTDTDAETSVQSENLEVSMFLPKKRGKNHGPTEIVEVKQDDLTKDRPRADQMRLTGIAFGPGYQAELEQGKPSKLHKRKHQIGSLFYDMKQKEMEFAERRARGLLSKAQTQGKYGW